MSIHLSLGPELLIFHWSKSESYYHSIAKSHSPFFLYKACLQLFSSSPRSSRHCQWIPARARQEHQLERALLPGLRGCWRIWTRSRCKTIDPDCRARAWLATAE